MKCITRNARILESNLRIKEYEGAKNNFFSFHNPRSKNLKLDVCITAVPAVGYTERVQNT